MRQPISGINPRILVWAREKSGQTIEDVANALKKDPSVIRSWESGKAAPTYVQLETLAYRIYKRPLALFFFPQPPPEPDPEQSFRTLPDSEIQELIADTRHKIREARAMQISISELAGANPGPKNLLRDISASGSSQASAIASAVRDYLGIDLKTQKETWRSVDEALKGWRSQIEEAGIFVFKDSFKQKDVFGFSLNGGEYPIILVNNSTTPTRQIFTLFHELAHLLVHTGGVTKENDDYISRLTGDAKRIEIFCNQFAANFLVPNDDFRRMLRQAGTNDAAVADLARSYKVSREVILRRFLDLSLVTRSRYETMAARWRRQALEHRRQESGGNYYLTHASYLSDRYARLAFAKFYRGSISIEQLANYLNVSVRSVPGLEQAVLQKGVA